MMSMRQTIPFLLALVSIPPILAFTPPKSHNMICSKKLAPLSLPSSSTPPPISRSLTVLSSAKVLPVAYASASAALLYKATIKLSTSTKAEIAVLLSTSALSLINFAQLDNAKLKSAKIAYTENTEPSSSGQAKQERQAALTWKSVVRIKIIGNILGLLRMCFAAKMVGLMRGAAIIMGGNLAFLACGAGRANHNDEGKWEPMPSDSFKAYIFKFSAMFVAALIASFSPVDSLKCNVAAVFFTMGALGGINEALSIFLKKK